MRTFDPLFGPAIRRRWHFAWVLLSLSAWFAPDRVRGDVGVVRARATGEVLVVTVFTAPALSSATATELAVLVQRRDNHEPVLDARVELRLIPPAGATIRNADVFCGPSGELPPSFRRDGAGAADALSAILGRLGDPLMHGARVRLPSPGEWGVQLSVRRGADSTDVRGVLPVGGPAERLWAVWPSLLLPPMAVVLFAVHRMLRRDTPFAGARAGIPEQIQRAPR